MKTAVTSHLQKLKKSVICTLVNHLADKETATRFKNALDPNVEILYGCEDMMTPQTLHIVIPAVRLRNPFLAGNRLLEMVQREMPECDGVYVNYTTAEEYDVDEIEAQIREAEAASAEGVKQSVVEEQTPETIQTAAIEQKQPTTLETIQPAIPEAIQNEDTEAKQKQNLIARLLEYMKANFIFRYNVLTRQSEVKAIGDDDSHYRVVTKHMLNTIIVKANICGVGCWDRDVKRIIESTFTHEYHPLVEYFTHLSKWDGKDRLTELAKRVSSKESWVENFSIWMRAWVAQMMNYSSSQTPANCVAIILISEEQGWGKSSFLRNLLPPDMRRYYTERLNLASEESCEKKLARFGLINIDEFDRLSEKHMALLKNITQEQVLNVQFAYESTDTPLHRIASFAGTSNRRDLLTDRTGSRRFICVELEQKIDCNIPIEYEQLFAQVVEEIYAGKPIYFDKEHERRIEMDNRPFYRPLPEEDAFLAHFEMADKATEGAKFMTSSQIYNRLEKLERPVMRGITANRFSRLLPTMGHIVRTKYSNGYYVMER